MKKKLIKALLSVTIVLLLMGIVFGSEMSENDTWHDSERIQDTSDNTDTVDYANISRSINKNFDKRADNDASRIPPNKSVKTAPESKKGTALYMYPRSGDKKDATIKVSGKLLDNDTGIRGETVTINVNDKIYTATTGGYGYFTTNHTITSYDNLNVTFTYEGNSKYLSSTNSTVYTVKKPTNIYMYTRNGDTKDSTIKVSGKLQYNDGEGVKGEKITIKVNDKTYTATTGGYGYFTTNHTITSYDDLKVTFTYTGSTKYISSKNSTIYTVKKPTSIYMYTRNGDTLGSTIKVSGKLLYGDKGVKGEKITIKVNDKTYAATTGGYGYFTTNHTISSYDDCRITFRYAGSVKYFSSTNSTVYIVKKPTTICVNKYENIPYSSSMKIGGKLLNGDKSIKGESVTISVNNKKYSAVTDEYGVFAIDYRANTPGINNVTCNYKGSSCYFAGNASTTFNTIAKETRILLDKINNVEYSDYVIISGKYVDVDNNPLTYTPMTITINDEKYVNKSDSMGNFLYHYKTRSVGTNNVSVSYHGNVRYNATKESVSFNVTLKSTRVDLLSSISNGVLYVNGKFVDTGGRNLTFTPMDLVISYENIYSKSSIFLKRVVYTDGNGLFNYSCKINDAGVYSSKVSYKGNSRYHANSSVVSSKFNGQSYIFANSIQGIVNRSTSFEVNVTDELNNSISSGTLSLYLNNKLLENKKVSSSRTIFSIPGRGAGVYDLKISYSYNDYRSSSKLVKLVVNPVSDYSIRLIWNPAMTAKKQTKLSGHIRIKNSENTLNSGQARFYLNNKYIGSSNVKNNLSYVRFNVSDSGGDYTAQVDYYRDNKFIGSDCQIVHVRNQEAQVKQETFITLASDLVHNSKISSAKKDVYFAMDRTTHETSNYSPNDMKIMNAISSNLRANGFNVKTVRNGPGETYNTARYMYNNNIRNSICFILCNGVDANVIREYLKGNDGLLTTVRNRGNDIVLGWFYGAGNIYDPDAEYYYYLHKAWDDNYSGKGGISNPRRTMERDGIKIVYERNDLTGGNVADSFIKLYGGNVTSKIKKDSGVSLKTVLYNVNNNKISGGNIVYTVNGHVVGNVTVKGNSYTFTYRLPSVEGTYNLKTRYYLNNKLVCQSFDRYVRVY